MPSASPASTSRRCAPGASRPLPAASAAERPPEERARILDEFYGRYERLVAKSPAGHGMDYIHIHLVCVKE